VSGAAFSHQGLVFVVAARDNGAVKAARAADFVTSPATPGPVMPTWLPSALVLLFATAAIILAISWWVTRKNRYAIGAGVALTLAAAAWLLNTFLVTDEKQIIRALQEMEAAVQRHDPDGVFKHVAADFTVDTRDRKTFRQAADRVLREGIVDDVVVYDFRDVKVDRPNRTATLEFTAVPKQGGSNQGVYRVEATFVLEVDNQWRMKTFKAYPGNSTTPVAVP
jgi:hypothetical protein